jgi:hypothetical protein
MAIERRLFSLFFLTAAFSLAPRPLFADSAAFPSTDDIQKLVDSQQYSSALHELQRVLALNGAAANPYDRYKLLMLRAESELQLRQQPPALDSLKGARAEAFKQSKPELAEDPIALIFLIQKSVAYQYTPRVALAPGSTSHFNPSIPILDRTRRGEAYGALLIDEFPAAEKKVAAIAAAKTIAPVLEAAKSSGNLRALEYAETRDTQKTAALTTPVAEKAAHLLDQALIDSSTRVETIAESAQQIVVDNITVVDQTTHKPFTYQRTRRRGLSDRDASYLQSVKATCEKVSATALEIAQSLDAEFDAMNVSIAKADAMKSRVHDLLTDNYLKIPPQ